MLYLDMERAGCSIQQATAEQWLFGRNFSKYKVPEIICVCIAIRDYRAVAGVLVMGHWRQEQLCSWRHLW